MPDPVSGTLRIRAELQVREVNWPVVLSILTSRFGLSFDEADARVRRFISRTSRALSLGWFLRRTLPMRDQQIVAAVCEAHGADIVTLKVNREYQFAFLNLGYRHVINFEINSGKGRNSNLVHFMRPIATLTFKERALHISSLPKVMLAQTIFLFLALLFFVVVYGCLLYSLAVFMQFLRQPAEVTLAATKIPSIGLALLCFSVGVAGICGRAIFNITALIHHRLSSPKRAGD